MNLSTTACLRHATLAAAFLASTGAGAAAFPGPDNFGYVGTDIVFNLRDISATGSTLLARGSSTLLDDRDDSTSDPVNIGFSFNFYGTSFTQVTVSTNGFITFTPTSNDACCGGEPIPTSGDDMGNFIAPWWDDLDPGATEGGIIRSQTVGSAGSREFIVGFYDVAHFSDNAQSNTFEVILHEGSNDIEVQYQQTQVEGNHDVAIGIENAEGTDGIEGDFLDSSVGTDQVQDRDGTIFTDGQLFFDQEGFCLSFNGTTCNATVIGSTPEQVAEVTEESSADTAAVQTTVVSTNVTSRVRTAFRSVGFGAPGPGKSKPSGGAPAGSPGGAPGGAPGDNPQGYLGDISTGRAAGDGGQQGYGVWVSPSYTNLNGTNSEGHTVTFGAGADALVDENTVVGLGISFESSDTDLTGALAGNSTEVNGGSLVLYGGRRVAENTLVDGFVGYGMLDNTSIQAGTKSKYDSRRVMLGGTISQNLDVSQMVNVVVSGGMTYSSESFDSFQFGATTVKPATVSLVSGSLQAEVSGQYGQVYPYGVLGVDREIDNSASKEDTTAVFGAGLVAYPAENLTLDVSVLVRRGEFNDAETLNANLRWTF